MSVNDNDKLKLPAYLKNKKCTGNDESTNTRIGDKDGGVYGGNYHIPDSEYLQFINKYYNHVFIKNNPEYLTEKQLIDNGPILIDIDLHYDTNVTTRQHSNEHIVDLLMAYMPIYDSVIDVPENITIEVYVMEKPNVNKLKDKTKDGIHILICLSTHKSVQSYIRDKLNTQIPEIWDDLPIINQWDDVLDEGVVKGFVNWQLYGSRKPNHEAYLLSQIYNLKKKSNGWSIIQKDLINFNIGENLIKLSARYTKHPSYDIKSEMVDIIEDNKKYLSKNKKALGKPLRKIVSVVNLNPANISNQYELDEMIEDIFDDPNLNYIIKETYDFTMSLSNSFYGPGSHNKWIRVGWALSNTIPEKENITGFLIWLKFSCQENCRDTLKGVDGKFDWSNVDELYTMWQEFSRQSGIGGLTDQSIRWWLWEENKEKYDEINEKSVKNLIDKSVILEFDHVERGAKEYDIASVAKQLYKDKFVCVSIKQNRWYEYRDQRWFENDSGNSLRELISTELHSVYQKIIRQKVYSLNTMDQSDEKYEFSKKQINRLCDITCFLRKTQWKNNIMKECAGMFYDGAFMNKLDQNPYLLCFKNCVVDFKKGVERKGQPDDYISKCTNIDYTPYDETKNFNTIVEINDFFKELFPNDELRRYMWDHLASCCLGTNENQTFNIYTGSGRNGKSKLVDLMSKALGDYKGTVPITLITQKRNSIGSTSSEIVQLKGTRYAVMQEPSKGDKINEGIMKEITGGDPIQGRALFKDTITFIPQFKLVVCTNTLFDIKSNDDGTWRRIRVCDFMSKFLDNPYDNEDKFPKESFPHQYKIDKNIDTKFDKWAPILMSMLVKKSFENQGNVKDCNIVMSSSDKYREGQDYLTEFDKDMIVREKGEKIKKTVLLEAFKGWYETNYGRGNMPKGKELNDFMDAKYGKSKRSKGNIIWNHVKIIQDDESDDEEDNDHE
tara:strand:- start:1893 stop:4739 length:2847 start_codon:yes stop_codon:yes gene_type:complete